MFTYDLNPVLLKLGFLEIRYYSLAYILSFIIAIFVLQHYAKKKELNLTKEDIYDYIFYLILGVIIGGRLGHVLLWEPSYYFTNPLEILQIWHGGMAFHGGLIGAIIATYWFVKRTNKKNKKNKEKKNKEQISFFKIADIVAMIFPFLWALGRIANFINGELWGYPSNVSWCVVYENVCRHPYQIYSAIGLFILGLFLVWLYRKEYIKKKEGLLFFTFIALGGLVRFLIDFFRPDILYYGISIGQWMSLLMVVIGVVVIVKYYILNFKND